MNEIEKKEEEIYKIFGVIVVIDNWAKKAVSTNKFDGASVYNPHNGKELATALINAGYGDVKQAVREFAEKVKELVSDIKTIDWSNNRLLYDGIDQLVKETCGE